MRRGATGTLLLGEKCCSTIIADPIIFIQIYYVAYIDRIRQFSRIKTHEKMYNTLAKDLFLSVWSKFQVTPVGGEIN